MVAESDPARRPALFVAMRGLTLHARTPLATLLGGLLIGILAVASSVALPSPSSSPAHADTPKATTGVHVEVAPSASNILHPGQALQVAVTITNTTTDEVPLGTVDLYLAKRSLTSRSALDDWLRPDTPGSPGDLLVSEPTKAVVQPGATQTLGLTVPPASVGLGPQNAWGARGIAATLTAGKAVQAEGRSTFVWYSDEAVTPVNVSVVTPITTPGVSSGLIPSKALETYTGPTGLLSRQLDGVIDRPVAIAIDPMIIASIRILGTKAPPDAVAWLARLGHATNEIFPLGYADADIALEAQSGAGMLLAPLSFSQAIDPTSFNTVPPSPEKTPGSTATNSGAPNTPSPTPTPGVGTPPTTADLLSWNYTMTDIGWPGAGVVNSADLGVFAASGLTRTILSGTNVTRSTHVATPNATVAIAGGTGLVADDALSNAIRAAAMATTDEAWRTAMAEVYAQLAVVSAERPGTARTLLATFDRGWPPTATRLSQTLDALAGVPWQAPATLKAALAAAPTPDVAFRSQSEPDGRIDLGRLLLKREAEVTAFSTALADPVALTATQRLDLLGLLATSWTAQPAGWRDEVSTSLATAFDVLRSVNVTTRGPINVAANKVDFPITLRNEFDQAVTVRLQVVPSNGRLVVGSGAQSTIAANSARTVSVPVTAAIGNGSVTLRVTMYSLAGVPVGDPALIAVNVQADWEGIGAWILAILIILFFGFGVWRNILRRRREREEFPLDPRDPPKRTDPPESPELHSPPESTELAEPTEPTEPSEPTGPAEPAEPAGPTDQTEPPTSPTPPTSPDPAADERG